LIGLFAASYFSNNTSDMSDRIDYNERFTWCGPTDMTDEYSRSLSKGLPFPILTVAEYLSLDDEGFRWGRIYRKAGYFSAITLWLVTSSFFLPPPYLFALRFNPSMTASSQNEEPQFGNDPGRFFFGPVSSSRIGGCDQVGRVLFGRSFIESSQS